MSKFDEKSLPCLKGGGPPKVVEGYKRGISLIKKIPQTASQTVFDPGRNYKLLPALAKNMPQAYFLYASRPLGKGAFERFASKPYASPYGECRILSKGWVGDI